MQQYDITRKTLHNQLTGHTTTRSPSSQRLPRWHWL